MLHSSQQIVQRFDVQDGEGGNEIGRKKAESNEMDTFHRKGGIRLFFLLLQKTIEQAS